MVSEERHLHFLINRYRKNFVALPIEALNLNHSLARSAVVRVFKDSVYVKSCFFACRSYGLTKVRSLRACIIMEMNSRANSKSSYGCVGLYLS